MKKKFLIVDGNSLVYRAFYALPLLTNGAGEFTNAAYGFTTMFLKILDNEKPDFVAICFDKGKVTFRNEQYKEYKAHRKATPPELRPQFALVKRILTAMGIIYEELEGFEADDLIGTLVQYGEKEGLTNQVLTGDKDSLQLVSPDTNVLLTKKGISEMEIFDEKAIEEKYGLTPKQIIDLKGLMGDTSDNIPGVPGVGEKTALKLLHQFGTIENTYAQMDQVSGKKLKEKLIAHEEQAFLSKRLATIECGVPMDTDINTLKFKEPDYGSLLEIFKELEFKTLVKGILERMSEQAEQKTPVSKNEETLEYLHVDSEEEITGVLQKTPNLDRVALYVTHQGNYCQGDISVISCALSSEVSFTVFLDGKNDKDKLIALRDLLESDKVQKIVYNAKDLQVLFTHAGINISPITSDVMLGAYLLNPSESEYSLETLSLEYLNKALVPKEDKVADGCAKAIVIWELASVIENKILEQGMDHLYRFVELPLEDVLSQMELLGIKVEIAQLQQMSQELGATIDKLNNEIYVLAGEEFNINSPKQLAHILFEKLGLPPIKKTKTGYSTNAEVLEQLASKHDIVAKILEHRTLVKLKSTYVDGLQGLINPETGKLHTSFNQTVTATGRLSSTEPNLQNIPIRMELGRQIRKAFVPAQEENRLLAADYSQIELRVLAHISQDPVLKEAFLKNQDIHTRTAAEVFEVPMEEVNSEMRRRAKAVNFGIVYGISDYGLSRDLGIARKEAKQYIDSYFARYAGVAAYLDKVVADARETGYVTTLLNRRRYLPDLFSPNFNVRSFGERTAMNTPIQGSAADIIKVAMVNIQRVFEEKGYKSKMLLQVHDELIFDVVPEELEVLPGLIKDLMENALELDIPLKVDLKMGENWYDMKKLEVEI